MTGAAPRRLLAAGAVALAGATAAMAHGIEPFSTWFYPFAWFSTLLMLDAAVALRDGRFFFLGRPAFLASVLLWSVPFWLLFELLNFRIRNWYYVFVPADPLARTAGIGLSFATVLPAILGVERLLDSSGVARGSRIAPLRVTSGLLTCLQGLGLASLGLSLAWPGLLFPLVWGAATLLADPFVYRRDPRRSLLGDLERGRPGRILRLLAGGLAIGLLWELFNLGARGKWIYTVPGLEELKLFEMPLLGFLGFPIFALDGFAIYHALVVTGLAVPPEGRGRPAPAPARRAAAAGAAVFAAAVVVGMGRETISSTSPRLAGLPGVPAAALERAGYDVFTLARARPAAVARATAAPPEEAAGWIEAARLAALRGIGTRNAARLRGAGAPTVEALAASDPDRLAARLSATGQPPIHRPRVRVWVRAARDAVRPP